MASDLGQFFHISANSAGAPIIAAPTVPGQTGAILYSVTINTKGTSTNVLTLYHGGSTSAPVIAVIDTTQFPGTYTYNCPVNAGLFYSLAGTGSAADITITFG